MFASWIFFFGGNISAFRIVAPICAQVKTGCPQMVGFRNSERPWFPGSNMLTRTSKHVKPLVTIIKNNNNNNNNNNKNNNKYETTSNHIKPSWTFVDSLRFFSNHINLSQTYLKPPEYILNLALIYHRPLFKISNHHLRMDWNACIKSLRQVNFSPSLEKIRWRKSSGGIGAFTSHGCWMLEMSSLKTG